MIHLTLSGACTIAALGFTLHGFADSGFDAGDELVIASNSGAVTVANLDALGVPVAEAVAIFRLPDPEAENGEALLLAAFTSTQEDKPNCSVEQNSPSSSGACSAMHRGAKKCSTMSGAHDSGHQCSVLGSTENVESPKCSVPEANDRRHKCSTWGESATGNTDACSVLNNARGSAECSVLQGGNGSSGQCSAMNKEAETQKCSVVGASEAGASCSVQRDSAARCTVLQGPSGSCSVLEGVGSCSIIGEAGTFSACQGDHAQ